MPRQLYLLLKYYLSDRYFDIKTDKNLIHYHQINAGVPQGSVLGPFLYLIYMADIRTTEETDIATFADDTATIAVDHNRLLASQNCKNILTYYSSGYKNGK